MGAFALTFEFFTNCCETDDAYDNAMMKQLRTSILKEQLDQLEKRKLYINKAIFQDYHSEDKYSDSDSEFDYESDIDVLTTTEEDNYVNKQLKNTTDTESFYTLYQ
jgi:hypothetical protein